MRLERLLNVRLHGFDSFEELPKLCRAVCAYGEFATGGHYISSLTRGCVSLRIVQGYTSGAYRREAQIVNYRRRLRIWYGSATTVLRHLKPHINVGSYIYLDELPRA
jgi:hypothetical protein